MGITPLPTAAQRQNDKSGVALERIENQQAIGAYHFTDNFKLSLQNAGWQINELITKIIDTPRQIAGRGQDDEQKLIHVVPGGVPQEPLPQGAEMFDPKAGEFDVTISSGPSFQSQREAASNFADLIVQQIDALPIAPQAKASILAISVKLKNIGPFGDEIAEIINPQAQQNIPPQVQQQMAQLQQQLGAAHQLGQTLLQKVQELEFEKKAQIVQNQGKIELEKMRIEASITTAEINTKAQQLQERIEFVHDMVKQLMQNKHDGGMKLLDAAHEAGMAGLNAQHSQALAEQNAQASAQQSAMEAEQNQQAEDADAEQ